jgi:hypothetical protein
LPDEDAGALLAEGASVAPLPPQAASERARIKMRMEMVYFFMVFGIGEC